MAFKNKVGKIGVITGRAISALILFATSLAWLNVLLNNSVSALATALMLTTLSAILLGGAYVAGKLRE